MATTGIAMRTKDLSGTTGTTTINYVNPEATSAQLQSLASAFNNLTTNTIVDVTRIDKQVLGSEIAKLPRNAKIFDYDGNVEITSFSSAELPNYTAEEYLNTPLLKYDGMAATDQIFIAWQAEAQNLSNLYFNPWQVPGASGYNLAIGKSGNCKGTLTVYLPETDTYAEQTLTLTITE